MYISANLPPMYGQFNKIRRDNYPFRGTFERYLETIANLGLSLGMDADLLVGVIEDALLGDMRLPDIPEGNETVKFRITTENKTIMEYFENSELTNKMIVMLVIRMTLRLSERFGTSISRLTKLVSEIPVTGKRELLPEPVKLKPVSETVVRPMSEPKLKPAKITPEPEPEKEPESDMLKRLQDLTEKGDKLLKGETLDGDSETVVTTNPFLNDFF